MSTTAGAEDLTALARRLAPEVVEEAVREARELARHQIVECLAREITRVAMEGIRPAVTPPRDLPPVPVSQSGSVPESESVSESVPESVPESTVATVGVVGPGIRPSSRVSRTDRGLYVYGIIPAASDTAGIDGLGADTEVDAIARDDARRHTGRPGRMFDCAYLVPRSEEDAFLTTATALTRELDAAGCPAEATGPWPPYSFVHITLGGYQHLGGTFDGHEDSPGGGAPVVDRVRTTDRVRTADRVPDADRVPGPVGGRHGAVGGRHGGGDD